MRFFIKLILTGLLCYFILPHTPWWMLAVIAFVVSLFIKSTAWGSFFSGFLGVGIIWLWSAWMIDHDTHSILTTKIATLFTLNNPIYLIGITSLLGGIVGAFASLTGHNLIKLFEKKRSGYY